MEKKLNNTILVVVSIVAIILVYLLKPILTPFLVGALLAYLGDPLVRGLMRFP